MCRTIVLTARFPSGRASTRAAAGIRAATPPGGLIPKWRAARQNKTDENKILMRAGAKVLTVLLEGRNIHFPVRGGEEKSHRGYFPGYTSANSWQEFLDNDPCHGLMACYNPANAALVNEILNAYSAGPDL